MPRFALVGTVESPVPLPVGSATSRAGTGTVGILIAGLGRVVAVSDRLRRRGSWPPAYFSANSPYAIYWAEANCTGSTSMASRSGGDGTVLSTFQLTLYVLPGLPAVILAAVLFFYEPQTAVRQLATVGVLIGGFNIGWGACKWRQSRKIGVRSEGCPRVPRDL